MTADSTSEAKLTSQRTRIFISYARSDAVFAERLEAALEARGLETFTDRQDITPGEDWWARIQKLIIQADTVVFVLSPDAVASPTCRREAEFGKYVRVDTAILLG
jgi:hypothetical protein